VFFPFVIFLCFGFSSENGRNPSRAFRRRAVPTDPMIEVASGPYIRVDPEMLSSVWFRIQISLEGRTSVIRLARQIDRLAHGRRRPKIAHTFPRPRG